jgi:drug/metabolite transporter (DMT)-like permease
VIGSLRGGQGRIGVVYIALTLIWGASFLLLKVALSAASPLVIVVVRLVLASLTLALVMAVTRRRWPRDRALWAHQAVVAALLCALPYLVVSWASQYVGTGLAGIITAATPMSTVAFTALLLPAERPGRSGVTGLLLGATGVVVIVGGDGLTGSVAGLLAMLSAPICYGAGYAYQRRFVSPRGLDGVTEAGMQVVLALGMALVATPLLVSTPLAAGGSGSLTLAVVLSIAALGVLSTGLGYAGNAVVLRAWGAQRTASISYLLPVISVALGVAVLGERLQWLTVAGGVVVVVGVLAGRGSAHQPVSVEARVVLAAEHLLSASSSVLVEATQSLEPTVDVWSPDTSGPLGFELVEQAPVDIVDREAELVA